MRYKLDEQQCRNLAVSAVSEWLLPNGIGGYAMGTAAGINTRRYHGLLIAAITPPTGRMNLLAAIEAYVAVAGSNPIGISCNQYPGTIFPDGYLYLSEFSLGETARWTWKASGLDMQKELRVHPGENAVTITYRNSGGSACTLTLRPLVQHRDHHGNFHEQPGYPQSLRLDQQQTLITQDDVTLKLDHPGAAQTPVQGWYYRFEHSREIDRGLEPRDDLYCPCELTYDLGPGEQISMVASVGDVSDSNEPVSEEGTDRSLTAALKAAAGKFMIRASQRTSIIAGYPWFTDWGRDTMISLPGLLIHTSRVEEARRLLSDYGSQMFQGLIPNRFVEKGERPDYNTVDATLWFANAIYKTLLAEWHEEFAREMIERLRDVLEWHRKGTLFGIKVDESDGLLTQGEPGVQLTWMDAKVGDWVVTPRHGKPVEINGLWINALNCIEWLAERLGGYEDLKQEASSLSAKAESNFEAKFWHEGRGHYLDTVDPADASLRPNQLIPMALPFSCVNAEHARRALSVVARQLITPAGVRTLGPEEPGYKGRYAGSLPELDAAYHQGTAWPWLLGSYATALVRFCDDRREAKRCLRYAKTMLTDYGLGGIAEVYDGDEPQKPGGCPYQAWSLGETLRAWVEDVGGD